MKNDRYNGGKGRVWHKIINQMPPHTLYIEPFLGAGAVMRAKLPAPVSIGLEIDPVIAARWSSCDRKDLTVIRGDAFEYLSSGVRTQDWGNETLIYCDPPYLMSTRRSQRPLYAHEMSDAEHASLLRLLLQLKCNVMISGYWSKLYADQLPDWRVITFNTTTSAGTAATEYLWCNFPEPTELHDYRFVGQNFSDREDIRNQTKRIIAKLSKMPPTRRNAILHHVQKHFGSATPNNGDV